MATTAVTLAQQIFQLDISDSDSTRRKAFFERGEQSLTEEERGILKALGMQVGDAMMESLRPYLAKFFDALPGCQTDIDIYLKKDCEIPYFVLWSILFGDYTQTEKRLSEARAAAQAIDLNLAQSSHAIRRLGLPPVAPSRPATPTAPAGPLTDEPLIRAIFTLQSTSSAPAPAAQVVPKPKPSVTPADLSEEALIRAIFTLQGST